MRLLEAVQLLPNSGYARMPYDAKQSGEPIPINLDAY